MSLPKVAVLGFHKNSHWSSLRIIKQRWEEIYRRRTQATIVDCDEAQDSVLPAADVYVLLDHRLPSQAILEQLAKHQKPIWWHIHGDLTIRVPDFFQALALLRSVPLQFVVASEAQRKLLTALLPSAATATSVIPYPIPPGFQAAPDAKVRWRTRFGIPGDHRVVGYAGRWSRQKGIVNLLQAARLLDDPTLHVLLAGHFDDLGFAQLTGAWSDTTLRQNFSKLVGDRVHLVPSLKPEEMPDFLAALDVFVCAGCFHDEDFNLTASEALSIGTPCVLSAWGGHLDHGRREKDAVTLLPPELSEEGYHVPLRELTAVLETFKFGKVLHAYPTADQLPAVPTQALATVSPSALAFQLMGKVDFLSLNGKLNQSLYRELYQTYL